MGPPLNSINDFLAGLAASGSIIGALSLFIINNLTKKLSEMASKLDDLQRSVSNLTSNREADIRIINILEKRLDKLEQ